MNTKTIFTLILLFVFFSCNKHTEQDTQADGNVSITIKKFQPGLSTKTAIDMVEERGATIWAENDCVGVFSAEGIQGSLIIKSGVGTNTATFVKKMFLLIIHNSCNQLMLLSNILVIMILWQAKRFL